ncbi:hypothetical protein HID58_069999 [Brassica napus]|uniref:Uncharacterized protein n=1 Tax=Brassica napus TaxID=3708 RepID=A0ABQ7YXG9_BRANA|nr:hypothetical protein HID58_069999 [Brassica napus]
MMEGEGEEERDQKELGRILKLVEFGSAPLWKTESGISTRGRPVSEIVTGASLWRDLSPLTRRVSARVGAALWVWGWGWKIGGGFGCGGTEREEERDQKELGRGGVESNGGKRWGERGDRGSGGSGGKGGGRRASPEVEDAGCTAEARPGKAQRVCIGKRIREKLTFFFFFVRGISKLSISSACPWLPSQHLLSRLIKLIEDAEREAKDMPLRSRFFIIEVVVMVFGFICS